MFWYTGSLSLWRSPSASSSSGLSSVTFLDKYKLAYQCRMSEMCLLNNPWECLSFLQCVKRMNVAWYKLLMFIPNVHKTCYVWRDYQLPVFYNLIANLLKYVTIYLNEHIADGISKIKFLKYSLPPYMSNGPQFWKQNTRKQWTDLNAGV